MLFLSWNYNSNFVVRYCVREVDWPTSRLSRISNVVIKLTRPDLSVFRHNLFLTFSGVMKIK